MQTLNITATDERHAAYVNDYVNRRTSIATPEHCLQQLVRRAVLTGVLYLRRGTPETSFTGKNNDELYGKAQGLAIAVEIATNGEISEDHIIAAARVDYANEA